MQIHFTGHNMEITPALRKIAEEKLTKLERYFDKIISMEVTFSIEKLDQIAEATIKVAKGKLHAHAKADDMYTAIDTLVERLETQLIKHKEKIHRHRD